VLDLLTIVVLASGLYLGLSRRRSPTVAEAAGIGAQADNL
jgi:hypothetical protein